MSDAPPVAVPTVPSPVAKPRLPPFARQVPPLTVGVELELQVVGRHDYDLTGGADDLLRLLGADATTGRVVPEMTDAMIELRTGVCRSHAELLAELVALRGRLVGTADRLGIGLCGGGTHPFQQWNERRIARGPRFQRLSALYGYLSKQFTVFGQHVHVGCPDGDMALRLMHGLQRHVPALIALAASSPFVQGVDTGFDSARLNAVHAFPLAGRAPALRDWAALEAHFDRLAATGIVQSLKDVYWDVRPKPEQGTVELRVMDCPLTVEKAAALAALVQCVAREVLEDDAPAPDDGGGDALLAPYNRFQACRFGLDGEHIDADSGAGRPLRDVVDAMLTRLRPHALALQAENALRLLRTELSGDGNDAAWLRRTQAEQGLLPELVRRQCRRWAGRD